MKEWLKDKGREMIGQGAEVRYKNDVDAYVAAHGVARDEAEKAVMGIRINGAEVEYATRGNNVETFKELKASLNEVFSGTEGMERAKQLGLDATAFRRLAIGPSSARDVTRAERVFRESFDKKAPAMMILDAYSRDARELDAVLKRMNAEIAALPHGADLRSAIEANPGMHADVGRALLLRKELDRHFTMFEREIALDKSIEAIKKNSRENIKKTSSSILRFLGSAAKAGLSPSTDKVFSSLRDFSMVSWNATYGAGEFLKDGMKLGFNFGKKLITPSRKI